MSELKLRPPKRLPALKPTIPADALRAALKGGAPPFRSRSPRAKSPRLQVDGFHLGVLACWAEAPPAKWKPTLPARLNPSPDEERQAEARRYVVRKAGPSHRSQKARAG